MILISGDFHGNEMHEMETLNTKSIKNFCENKKIDSKEIKYHIILGDIGLFFPNEFKTDMYNIDFFNSKPFITLAVLGNHDNYNAIETLPMVDIGIGSPVWKVSEKFYFLPRGKVYNIDGKKCLVLGGGLSIDKQFRTENLSWWKKEEWGYLETENLVNLLKKENKFDYIFSHTAPLEANDELKKFKINLTDYNDTTVKLNSYVYSVAEFKHWFFGHYHINFNTNKFSCLYKNLEVIK